MSELFVPRVAECNSSFREAAPSPVKEALMPMRRDLKQILDDGPACVEGRSDEVPNDFDRLLEGTTAAPDFEPIKPGYYRAALMKTRAKEVSAERAKCEATFRLVEGDEEGRELRHTITLTEKSARYAKRDLAKIGISRIAEFEKPADATVLYGLTIVTHADDEGNLWNRVKKIEVIGSVAPSPNPFSPENAARGVGGAN